MNVKSDFRSKKILFNKNIKVEKMGIFGLWEIFFFFLIWVNSDNHWEYKTRKNGIRSAFIYSMKRLTVPNIKLRELNRIKN